jgi:hypothetical protein
MRMVVVGGNSRNIGKTSVVVGLIRALPQYEWTAVKLTQYGHGICATDGKECDCAPEEHPFAVTEETDRGGKSDTSRFLAAGARRALWVRVRMGMLETVLPALREAIGDDEAVIIESNSILQYYNPSVYLTVLDPSRRDFKESARRYLARADGILVVGDGWKQPVWDGASLEACGTKPKFPISASQDVTPEIAAFVAGRMERPSPQIARSGTVA